MVVHLQIWKYLLTVDTSIMPVPQLLAQEFQVLPPCKKELTLFKTCHYFAIFTHEYFEMS